MKKFYVSPATRVVEIDSSSIIAQSPYEEDIPVGGEGELDKPGNIRPWYR